VGVVGAATTTGLICVRQRGHELEKLFPEY